MASLTQWTWVWTSSRRWWRTGKPSVLQSVGSQIDVTSDWTTKTARLFKSDGQSIDASASASVLPIYSQSWFPLGLTGLISLLSEWLSRVFPKPQKHHFCVCVCSVCFIVQLSHPYMTTGKTITLTISTFVGKVRSLLFNMLSRFVIAFLPRKKCLLISWLQTISSDLGTWEKKYCHCFHFFPFYLPWSDWTGCHDLSFLNFDFLNQLFHSPLSSSSKDSCLSSLSAIRMLSSTYLKLFIFLLAILIPACDSSSLIFCMIYSA